MRCQKSDEDYINWHYWRGARDNAKLCLDKEFNIPDLLQVIRYNNVQQPLVIDLRPIPMHDELIRVIYQFKISE